jgi:hypothetical protein
MKPVGLYAMLTDEQKEKALNADFCDNFGPEEYSRKQKELRMPESELVKQKRPFEDSLSAFAVLMQAMKDANK